MSVPGDPPSKAASHADGPTRDLPISAKMIAVLAIVLLPLGVIAVLAALQSFRLADHGTELTTAQALTVSLPLLMWIASVGTGWWVARHFVVQPLVTMQRALRRYKSGDSAARLSARRYVSREMDELAEAFDAMADEISRSEHNMRTMLVEQRRLTREVHHRVKNNLQIVSSLLSIQSRDAPTAEVAAAYAAVQARVGALALVHRWMYGDDAAQGVDLRALVCDLAANLEQSLASIYLNPVHVSCEVERVSVGQDTAVPIAFLITELLSVAASRSAPAPLEARLSATVSGRSVALMIAAPAFRGADLLAAGSTDPAARIIIGMGRQLRSTIRHDPASSCYVVDITLADPTEFRPDKKF